MDSVYFYDNSALYVNLFTPSTLDWKQRSVKVVQTTTFPMTDTTTLTVTGTGNWAMKIRIPSWTSGATISINGQASGVAANPGSYASLSRTWNSGDVVTVKLPMKLRTVAANDNAQIAAIAYGPIVLSGNYGQQSLNSMPSLALNSVKRTGTNTLAFTATANGKSVDLGPFYDAQGINYNVYWATTGQLPN
jgi:DUF1680 family protein